MSRPNPQASSPTPPPLTEKAIQAGILAWLRWHGYGAWRQNTGGMVNPAGQHVRFNVSGWPDVFAIKAGHAVFVEVKKPGEKPTPTQLEVHAELRHYGATVIVATSTDDLDAAGL